MTVAGGKYFADRQRSGREVVVAERSRLIGVVEYDQPPTGFRWRRAFGNHGEIGIDAPDGEKIVADLLLQGADDGSYIRVGENGAFVDDRDLNGRNLRLRNLWHGILLVEFQIRRTRMGNA